MTYRPDIDGLRAIAILFVLLFHSGLKLVPSGFIGVDIFFVISGFLITSILHNSLQKNRFSFLEFYSRRLWRLQPVFICLILATICVTYLFYLPEDLVNYFNSARKTTLFTSNSFFEKATKGYFSAKANELPLLHTWSLSIEWQCYLVLPLIMYALHRIFSPRHLSKVIYILTLFFLLLALYYSAKEPTKTYYYLSSRIFEFLIGSCVAFNSNRFSLNKYVSESLNVAALLVIFYIATRSNISWGFPNGYAFILCAAVSILIAAGKNNPQSLLTQLLSIKPLVFIGLISYSLYIWHWPVFVLIHYLGIGETTPVLALAFSFIFIISFLSWKFIEKPAQKFNTLKFGYSLVLLFITPLALINLGSSLVKHHEGYPQRFEETARIASQLKRYTNPLRPLCLDEKNVAINTNCVLGSHHSNSKTGFLFGDSHANHFWGFIDTLAQKANLSVLSHATSACLSLPGIRQYNWNAEDYTACYEQTQRYYTLIKKNHYDFVILGQNWEGYLGKMLIPNEPAALVKKRIERGLNEALQIIIDSGAKPILIKSIVTNNSYHCFLHHLKTRTNYDPKQCEFDINAKKSPWQDELFLRLKNKYSQLIIIDPVKVQCPHGRCRAEINGIPLLRDRGHLSDYASYHLATRYLKHYNNPFNA
ncbi:MAG: acyltransferase family protein [Legionella sp.]|uniref:acyltransferase family protein n=1 Tax=Legionella sp. TaxID=459 RepID=UPI0028501AF5|nr:acyltransferase family protein [Legionella sp.]